MDVMKIVRDHGVIPVLGLKNPDTAEALAAALIQGGLPLIEVTLRSEGALECLRRIKKAYPEMAVGAGTVLSVEQLNAAAQAGACLLYTSLAYTRKASRSFFALNRKDSDYFRQILASLDMGLEDRMKTRMGLLSGGQRQAAALLMATIARPKLLLLDEHTAALDPASSRKVLEVTKQIIAEDGLTALMITHDMEQALRLGSRTLMMDSGRIVLDIQGEERARMSPRELAELFGKKAREGLSDRTMLAL